MTNLFLYLTFFNVYFFSHFPRLFSYDNVIDIRCINNIKKGFNNGRPEMFLFVYFLVENRMAADENRFAAK